jgi:ferritin-like metal-binding protein YciE
MDPRPDALAEYVRAKRTAIDEDLEVLRNRLRTTAAPRAVAAARPALVGLASVLAAIAVGRWARRRRPYTTLGELLVRELSDLLATEERLLPALDAMSGQATSADLKRALEQHRRETAWHVDRLARALRSIGIRRRRGACDALNGVLEQADRVLRRRVDPEVRDAWVIASVQRAGHVEVAGYGTARSFALALGFRDAAQLPAADPRGEARG